MTHADGGITAPTPGGRPRLQELCYPIAIYPANLLMAAAKRIIVALRDLGGTPPELTVTGIAALFELAGLREWSAVGDTWTSPAS